MFTELNWDVGRLEKNEEAFAANPRDLSMCPVKLNNSGITFPACAGGAGKKWGGI